MSGVYEGAGTELADDCALLLRPSIVMEGWTIPGDSGIWRASSDQPLQPEGMEAGPQESSEAGDVQLAPRREAEFPPRQSRAFRYIENAAEGLVQETADGGLRFSGTTKEAAEARPRSQSFHFITNSAEQEVQGTEAESIDSLLAGFDCRDLAEYLGDCPLDGSALFGSLPEALQANVGPGGRPSSGEGGEEAAPEGGASGRRRRRRRRPRRKAGPQKERAYERQQPFSDREKERRRQDAIRAKRCREANKAMSKKLKDGYEEACRQRDDLALRLQRVEEREKALLRFLRTEYGLDLTPESLPIPT